MIWTRFHRQPKRGNIAGLYGMIVAQARSPSFYRDLAVPDTVNGRFDMIVLHLALVMWRLTGTGQEAFSQDLFDTFCRDMDGNLREMGISDLKVPKEMKRMGEAFYGRIKAYGACFSADTDAALAAAISRNIYGKAPDQMPDGGSVEVGRMTAYTRTAARMLQEQETAGLTDGRIRFPDPVAC
ncbi:MAG TPA: ubiquinol-cytochrome C chaperone family protein [Pseudolabrys sp.]|nr:ubiquinol-cytochrome C chaperone family protein [Pseudolabrys sp.]